MVKKVFLLFYFLLNWTIFSSDDSGFRWGLTLGFFFNHHDFQENNSTVDSQVDSLTLLLVNMKLGGLLRYGYHFNQYIGAGIESGVLFNTYQQQGPFRGYFMIGPENLNLKAIGGVTINRVVPMDGNGIDDPVIAGTLEAGLRLSVMNLYIEWLESNSFNDHIDDSTKISFGYSLFLPI